MQEIIRGELIKFKGEPKENGWRSALVRYENSQGMFEAWAAGCFNPLMKPGEWFLAKGEWSSFVSSRDGTRQESFRAKIITPDLPLTTMGLKGFLERTFLTKDSGVTKELIAAFIKKHGGDAAFKIEKNIQLLKELSPNPDRDGPTILSLWNKRISAREPFRIMQAAKVTDAFAQTVLDYHRDEAINVIKRNPYELAQIKGLSFKEVDKLGRYMNVPENDVRRVDAAVKSSLSVSEEGHTCSPLVALQSALPISDIKPMELIESIKRVGGYVGKHRETLVGQPQHFHSAESSIARNIGKILRRGRSVSRAEKERTLDIARSVLASNPDFQRFDEIQKAAVLTCVTESVACLTGGPGTGKSTVTEAIVDVIARAYPGKIYLFAPTGKAAVRMSEATKRSGDDKAKTVHKGLEAEFNGFETRYNKNSSDTLEKGCCVIIDESSMLDIEMTAALLDALPEDGRILFVGDRHQLESVGAGYVLGDIIETVGPEGNRVPCAELINVYRSNKMSDIAIRAAEIKSGTFDVDVMTRKIVGGVAMINVNTDKIVANVVNIFTEEMRQGLKVNDLSEIAVLCPQRKGSAGTHEINKALSKYLNADGAPIPELKRINDDEPTPRQGDRVMMTANDYKLDIMNGDVGKIIGVKKGKKGNKEVITHVDVRLDLDGRVVSLPTAKARSLVLAYAITGHKSQGSQYKTVILPVSHEYRNLTRTLFYTEWTRAKEHVLVIGEKEQLTEALEKVTAGTRRTMLPDLLKKELLGPPPAPLFDGAKREPAALPSPKASTVKFGIGLTRPPKPEPAPKPGFGGIKPFGMKPVKSNPPDPSVEDDESDYGMKP